MRLTEEKEYWFYPDVLGNLQLPKNERLAILIERPTAAMRVDFTEVKTTIEYYPAGNKKEELRVKKTRTTVSFDGDAVLKVCVKEVRNLIVDTVVNDDGKIKEVVITTGLQLSESRAYNIDKITAAIIGEIQSDKISEKEKKSLSLE